MDTQDIKQEIQQQRQMLQEYEQKIEKLEEQESEEKEVPKLGKEGFLEEEWGFFSQRPYLLQKEKEDSYHLHVPSIVDFQAGRFVGTSGEGRFKTFLLDNTTKMLQEVPEQVKQDPRIELDFTQKFEVKGNYLHYRNQEDKEFIENREDIKKHLKDIGISKAEIKPGHEFKLVKELFAHGYDPFTPSPVKEEDLRDQHADFPFTLYDYQEDWINEFMENGRSAFCGPTGSGKTAPALEIMSRIEGPKALIVSGNMTKGQWKDRIEKYAPEIKDEVQIETYHSVEKLQPEDEDFEYSLVVADECHALPANTFAAAALLPTKYRLGLSATPYREDERTPFIFALTGSPTGMDWDDILQQQGKTRHEITAHVLEDLDEKVERASEIYDSSKKTLIYTDGLDLGKRLAEELDLEFVSGEDGSKQFQKAKNALDTDNAVVISRIGDEGFSVDELEAIIEVDFLFGSRRQQLQRTGRLLHDDTGEKHDILFTEEEWERHKKRLSSPMNRGWEIQFDGEERELDLEEDTVSDVEIEVEDMQEDQGKKSLSQGKGIDPSTAGDMTDIEILKKDAVRKEIEKRVERTSKVADQKAKKMVLYVAKSEDPVTSAEIATQFSVDKSASSELLKVMREGNKPILKEAEPPEDSDRRPTYNRINRDAIDEIIEAEKLQENLEEDFNEVFG